MAIPEKTDEFTFGGGLQQQEDHWLQASGFTRLENCVQDKVGVLVKPDGYTSFSSTATRRIESIPNAAVNLEPRLINRGEQLGCVSNGYVYSKHSTWVLQGRCSPWVAELRTVVDVSPQKLVTTSMQESVRHDCCRSGDWSFSVFEYWGPDDTTQNSRLCVVATYLPTGATVYQHLTPSQTYGLNRPRIVAWDTTGKALLVYRREASVGPFDYATLCYRQVTPDTLGSEQTFAGFTCDEAFDVCSDTTAGVAWVAYHQADALALDYEFVDVRRYTIGASTLTQTHHISQATGVGSLPRAVAVTADHSVARMTLAYAQTLDVGAGLFRDEVRAFCLNATTPGTTVWSDRQIFLSGTFLGAFDDARYRIVKIGAVELGGATGCCIAFHDPNGGSATYGGEFTLTSPTTRAYRVSSTGVVDTTYAKQAGRVRMASRPFYDGHRVCFLAEHAPGEAAAGNDTNRYYALMGFEPLGEYTRARPFGHFAQATASVVAWGATQAEHGYTVLSTPYQDSDGAWHLQALERDPGTLRLRLRAYKLVADDRVGQHVEFGAQTYLAGALLSAWDGLRCIEAGWLATPVIELLERDPGALTAGTRHYRATYARTTASGELLRSRPSETESVTNLAGELNTLSLSPYCLSQKVDDDHLDVFVEVWRTKVNQASPFWLIARIPLDLNDRAVIEVQDQADDNLIDGLFQQTLPTDDTQGAEIPNDPPLSTLHLCHWRNRLWLTDGEQIAYSKEGLPSRAVEFSLLQTIPRGMRQQLTAIAPLGDVLVTFTEDSTAYVYGDAPAANGSGSTLTGPIELPTEYGCAQPPGLCAVPGGLLVPTRKGMQLLTLKREYAYVGQAIEDAFAARPFVRSADWQQKADRVWVALSNSAGTDSIFAVWDLQASTWALLFEGHDPVSVLSVGDSHHWTDRVGLTHDLAAGTYRIGTAEYRQLVETVWFKPGGALAEIRFKKAWLLAENLGVSGLTVECGFDFETAYTHVATFTAGDLAALEGAANDILMLRIPAPRQRCHAVRFRITETLPTTIPAGEAESRGFRFVAMRLLTALRGAKGPLKAPRNAGTGFV